MPEGTTKTLAKSIRIHALEMVHKANASHIGSCLSMADLLAVLYGNILHYDPARPDWPERDRVILSKGHACVIMYAVLAECGYFDPRLLEDYGSNGTEFQGHLSHYVRGVELSTGSLGHGLPVACGLAFAVKSEQASRRVFAILSDGELDEGSNWEAILFAGHHKLHPLTAIIDYNKIQSFGSVSQVLELEPLADKWRACHWHVIEVDGHDHDALSKALAHTSDSAPTVIIAHTIKGKGVSFMENELLWHYRPPSAEQLQTAIAEIEAAS